MFRNLAFIFIIFISHSLPAQAQIPVSVTEVDSAWAGNSINAVVFRKNSIATYRDTQLISFYNTRGFIVIGKRKSGETKWLLNETKLTGNIRDAHNSISMMVDGEGYIHMAWDHHNGQLNYCRSQKPLSFEFTDNMPMSGKKESSVTYPEFYKMPNGNLIFLYRDGGSGQGNLVLNSYDVKSNKWNQIQDNLIDGEGKRNAYWQTCIDDKGVIHISWVWRESPDVASNHDMCYARSADGGKTWEKSSGEKYILPITASSAEYVAKIPQNSELINQTSMSADANGNPIIASYWRDSGSTIPQYHILYKKNKQWNVRNPGFRYTTFSLNGTGTKQIPISRPQVISWNAGRKLAVAIIFRDAERNNKVSIAGTKNIFKNKNWKVFDLTALPVGAWEPSYDTELWRNKQMINLFVQYVEQGDAETVTNIGPQMISVLEFKPRL